VSCRHGAKFRTGIDIVVCAVFLPPSLCIAVFALFEQLCGLLACLKLLGCLHPGQPASPLHQGQRLVTVILGLAAAKTTGPIWHGSVLHESELMPVCVIAWTATQSSIVSMGLETLPPILAGTSCVLTSIPLAKSGTRQFANYWQSFLGRCSSRLETQNHKQRGHVILYYACWPWHA
jgi:hypothetical protein